MSSQDLMRFLTAGAALVLNSVARVDAQVPNDYPVVGVTVPGDCAHAPDIYAIRGYSDVPGVYDFWIYPIVEGNLSGARFGVFWPSEWTLLEAELCFGTLLQGELESPWLSGITLGLPSNQSASQAAIRYRIDASSDGLLEVTRHPKTNDLAYRLPDGEWRSYYGDGYREYYVMIGERNECSNMGPIYWPASWCSLVMASDASPGSISIPSRLELPPATIYSDTLSGWATDCQGTVPPECGQPYGGACIDGANSDADWLAFEALDWMPGPIRLAMTVDTRGMNPGSYTTRVVAGRNCGNCGVICRQVTLIVGPVAVRTSTWGQIKARHRD